MCCQEFRGFRLNIYVASPRSKHADFLKRLYRICSSTTKQRFNQIEDNNIEMLHLKESRRLEQFERNLKNENFRPLGVSDCSRKWDSPNFLPAECWCQSVKSVSAHKSAYKRMCERKWGSIAMRGIPTVCDRQVLVKSIHWIP